jgi:glycosyltransferase involved in cell wall biosynthesis
LSSVVKESSVSISVLVPVLGRPANAAKVAASLEAASGFRHELLFICTEGDSKQIEACRATERGVLEVAWPPERDYGRKMNAGYRLAQCDWLLLGSDDITFEPGWDAELLRVAAETGKRVVGSNDKANRTVQQGVFSTHTLVARSYVEDLGGCLEGPGHLVSEAYDHNFVDRELAALAQARGEWAFAPNAVIRHHHPAFGGAQQDATYEKGRNTFFGDQMLFWERAEQWGFVGLLPQEISLIRRRKGGRRGTARARREAQR